MKDASSGGESCSKPPMPRTSRTYAWVKVYEDRVKYVRKLHQGTYGPDISYLSPVKGISNQAQSKVNLDNLINNPSF